MKKESLFDLSIIIVVSKSGYAIECLKSVFSACKGINIEVILVDNATKDNFGSKLKDKYSKIKVIRKKTNGGFGENNNLGLKVAKGKYVLLLNDDTKILDSNIFKEMISWMEHHKKVGVASCALVNPDGKSYQGSGGYFPDLFRVFAWMSFLDDVPFIDRLIKPYHPLHPWSFYKGEAYFGKVHEQDWVTGAFFLMRKKALNEVGFFDTDFFLYVEEVELSFRFKKKGWQIWYIPKWKIIHYGQTTTGSEKALINELLNLILLYKKHYPSWQLPILKLTLKLGCVLRFFVFGLLKGSNTARIYQRAFMQI